MRKKIVRYVPPPLPNLTIEETVELEKKLRGEIDSWARLQADPVQRNLWGKFWKLLPTHPRRRSL